MSPGSKYSRSATSTKSISRGLRLSSKKRRGKRPEGCSNGPEDYRRLVAREDLDAIVAATPRELHTPVAVAAMKSGKYAATEVPAAIEQCWDFVKASEQT